MEQQQTLTISTYRPAKFITENTLKYKMLTKIFKKSLTSLYSLISLVRPFKSIGPNGLILISGQLFEKITHTKQDIRIS